MNPQQTRPSFWKSPFGIVATLVAVAASGYLWLVHQEHVLALLPFALLAACPLMHVFMHGGHGHGGHGGHRGDAQQDDQRLDNDAARR
jgi:hypothetical protein